MFQFVVACVFERIQHSFFDPYSHQMRFVEATLQYFENFDGEIFRGGHGLGEFFQGIQILKVETKEHFPFDEAVEIDEVADHASSLIDLAAYRDFECVVVAVSVGIIALSVGSKIFGGRHVGIVETMRSGEAIAAGKVGFHFMKLVTVMKLVIRGTGLKPNHDAF
jgi:hypothetical protein